MSERFFQSIFNLKGIAADNSRVKIGTVFQNFIQKQVEEVTSISLRRERFFPGIVFRHRGDLTYGTLKNPKLYIETKIISRPERVAHDHDKRLYEVAFASVDLKLRKPQKSWELSRSEPPFVAFAFAVPVETPLNVIANVDRKMSGLLDHYLDACCLYIYDIESEKRRDDLLYDKRLSLNYFLTTLEKIGLPKQHKITDIY